MKKWMMLCLVLVMSAGVTMAQKPQKKAPKQFKTTTFVTNLDCPNCAKKVETNVPVLGKGIKDMQIDLATRELKVTYDTAKNNDENIIKGLESLKVEAEVKAEPQGAKK